MVSRKRSRGARACFAAVLAVALAATLPALAQAGCPPTPLSHSLQVSGGGSAVSPAFCISSEYPTFRFFAHQLGDASTSPLNVSLRWVDVLGVGVDTGAGSLHFGYGQWSPSPVMRLGSSVPLWMPGSTLAVRLVFRAAPGGSWAVDDTYLDPYRR